MLKSEKVRVIMTLMRLALGWLFFYAGITKVLNPEWTAAGYLKGAQTLSGFYAWLASEGMIGFVNFLNQWGLTLIGLSLIIGALVRLSSILGAIIMLLYYVPILNFPKVGEHSWLIDEHIIYALVLLFFFFAYAGRFWGVDEYIFKSKKIAKKFKIFS